MADQTVRTFDPKQVVINFGPVIMTGYAEGTFVTIDRTGDLFTETKGADGGVDRVNNNNNMFNVEVTLKQTSTTNDELSAILATDLAANGGIYQLLIQDVAGTSLFVAAQCWIKKDPESEYSDVMSNRTWTFACLGAKFDGSNV
jgi:hypothetical protein